MAGMHRLVSCGVIALGPGLPSRSRRSGAANLGRQGSRRLGDADCRLEHSAGALLADDYYRIDGDNLRTYPVYDPGHSRLGIGSSFNKKSLSRWSTSARSATQKTGSKPDVVRLSRSIPSGRGRAIRR